MGALGDKALRLDPTSLRALFRGARDPGSSATRRRLERSARTFRAGAASTNYHDNVLAGLLARHTGA